jgi:hypothetical protein
MVCLCALFECDHVVLLCQICDQDENRAAHQSEISCEIKKKKLRQCFQLLKEVYGDNFMSRMRVFEWHRWFMEDRKEAEDDKCLGCPSQQKPKKMLRK